MMPPYSFIDGLYEATVVATLMLALIGLLRPIWRRAFGSGMVYSLWFLLPLALGMWLIPVTQPLNPTWLISIRSTSITTPFMPVEDASTDPWLWFLCSMWFVGALLMAASSLFRQRASRRVLGALQPIEGRLWVGRQPLSGPITIGLFRPRIVIPSDFDQRYNAEQKRLVLAHERLHVKRGDLWANALGLALLCCFWFHPLAHWAFRKFRCDQELSCDERVLRSNPHSRRSYAHALLNVDPNGHPGHCQWSSKAFMKERIKMTLHTQPGARRRRLGMALTALLMFLTASVLAEQTVERTDSAERLFFSFKSVLIDEASARTFEHQFAMGFMAGDPAGLRTDLENGEQLAYEFQFTQPSDDRVLMSMELFRNEQLIAEPTVQFEIGSGKGAVIEASTADGSRYRLEIEASRNPPQVPSPGG